VIYFCLLLNSPGIRPLSLSLGSPGQHRSMAEEDTAPAEEPSSAGANGGHGKGESRERKPRDETPVEDLYDLSKPIPRVSLS